MAFFVIDLITFVWFFDIFDFDLFAYIWKIILEMLSFCRYKNICHV